MENWEKLFWIIFIIIVICQIYFEFKHQNCHAGKNECGDRWKWDPNPSDELVDIVKKIQYGTDAPTLIVTRTINLLKL